MPAVSSRYAGRAGYSRSRLLSRQPAGNHPIGLGCSRIEAHYKLLVGRPSLRHAVTTNMAEQIKLDVAGVVVAPLALADLILTEQEKLKGCALIDFGAGVTSVTMYKDGSLAGLYVIPLGSHLITRDLMSLGMPEKEAERVKRTYGNAIWEKDNEQQMVTGRTWPTGQHSSEIKLSDINMVVEVRSREIIEKHIRPHGRCGSGERSRLQHRDCRQTEPL